MRTLIRFALDNAVLANLLFVGILLAGGIAGSHLPKEVFPEFSKAGVEVTLRYPNASPREVERLVTIPVEEAADGIQGTYEIRSVSSQDFARVFVQLQDGQDVQVYLDDLRQAMDAIQGWPEDAEDPVAQEMKLQFPVLAVNLFGNLEEEQVLAFSDELRSELKAIPGVSNVVILGDRRKELRVEILPAQLERYGLSLAKVSQRLSTQVRNLPGGTLETSAGEIRLRVLGEEVTPDALGAKVLYASPDGTHVLLRDVARITSSFEKEITRSRYNGYSTVTLQLAKEKKGDVIDIVRNAEAIVEASRAHLPDGLSIGVSSDFSIYVKNRLRTLLQSGMFGLALVILILWVFLDARVALMTAMGIPMAVTGAMLLMGALGITMNMLSMFAFILVMGLVVDDAIVVVENAFRYVEKGMSPKDAAFLGASEVAWPVLTTVATTIAAFGAMLMIEGELGQWMSPVPWVASLTLLASLVEALIVLPVHFGDWVKPIAMESSASATAARTSRPTKRGRWYDRLQRHYEKLLKKFVRHRYAVLLGALCLSLWAGSLFLHGHLKFVMMPKFEAKLFMVNVETPTSNSLDQTSDALRPLEQAIAELPPHEKESIISIVGASYSDQQNYKTGPHLGQIMVELSEGHARQRSTEEIKEGLRQRFGTPAGVTRLDFTEPQAGPPGKAIEMHLASKTGDGLVEAAEAVKGYLAGFSGVRDVRDDRLPGAREIRIHLTAEGRMLGFTEAEVGRQILGAFHGDRAAILRLGRDPADLLVRQPEAARFSFEQLHSLRLQNSTGDSLALARVARLEDRLGLVEVQRRDRHRSITVTADVTLDGNSRETIGEVMKEFQGISKRWPGVTLTFGGDQERQRESVGSMFRAMGLSALIIFALLVLLFRSYLQPIVVLASVPFAGLGVMFGFTAIGMPISFMTMLGMMALIGVAVNDSLVLMDFVNNHRRAGHGMLVSVFRAGAVRMRPVLLTSLTTIGGLAPLAFFASGQARFLSPMAMALVFGMVTSTVMTLLLVPCGYVVLQDFYALGRRVRGFFLAKGPALTPTK